MIRLNQLWRLFSALVCFVIGVIFILMFWFLGSGEAQGTASDIEYYVPSKGATVQSDVRSLDEPALWVHCYTGRLTWECRTHVYPNGSDAFLVLAVHANWLIGVQEVTVPYGWGYSFTYKAPPACYGEFSRIELHDATCEGDACKPSPKPTPGPPLDEHIVVSRCVLVPILEVHKEWQ